MRALTMASAALLKSVAGFGGTSSAALGGLIFSSFDEL